MFGQNVFSFVLIGVFVSFIVLFMQWEHRDEQVTDGGYYSCMMRYFGTKIVFNSTVSERYKKPRNRLNCTPLKLQNVDLLGIVLTYNKSGTVLHKDFYQSICSWMGINYAYTDYFGVYQLQQNSYLYWMHSQKIDCSDYHKCNDRAIIQAQIDINNICLNSGVKCDDCPSLKILNPIRDPFELVISAYLYHSGEAHEKWAKTISMRQLGFSFKDEINNLTVNQALNSQNPDIGLEISFQIVSDDLEAMLLMKNLEKNFKFNNIKSFKFEKIVGEFETTMSKELEFLGIFKPGDLESDKQSVIKYGQWVMSDTHRNYLQEIDHITADKKISKKYLRSILQKHDRAEQLYQIAESLGYDNPNYQA